MPGKPGKDSAVLQVVVSKEAKKKIDEAAKKEGRSTSNWLRFLAERALDSTAAKG